MKRGTRILAGLAAMAAALVIAFFAGRLSGNTHLFAANAAETALEQTGLPGEYAPPYAMHGMADGRDSFEQTVFCIEYEQEREALQQIMSRTEGWRIAEANAEDYRRFAETAMWGYQSAVQVQDDVTFDAWYYRETAEPYNAPGVPDGPFAEIGQAGRGFVFAVFNAETGLFIFVRQFG